MWKNFLNFIYDNLLIFISYLFVFFTPIGAMLLWTGVMVTFDLITGALKDKKLNNAEIRSRKMRPTVLKGMGYMMSLIIAVICQNLIAPEYEIVKGVFVLIFAIEAKSIDENINALTGFSFLKPLKKYIDKLTDKDNE